MDMNHNEEQIPFLALQIQSDWTAIHTGRSLVSGPFIVEEKLEEDDDKKSKKKNSIFSIF